MERSKTAEMLEGGSTSDERKSGQQFNVEVLREMVTEEDKTVIKRF